MTDARHFKVEETLRNGTAVTIRAVRPDDRERLAKAFGELERDSVYTRYFAFKRELSAAELATLDTMDFVRDVMLVATIGTADGETVIGSGHYIAHDAADGSRPAEVAFTVEEDYQGLGIAGRLFEHLIRIARESGIERFEAFVLPGNKSMLAVFARSGLPMEQRVEEGTVHLTLDLGANP